MWVDVNHTTATRGARDEKIIRQIKKGEYLSRAEKRRLRGYSGLRTPSEPKIAETPETPAVLRLEVRVRERRVDVIELAAFAKLYRKPVAYFLG